MKRKVFADTFYWVALINPQDDWHSRAIEVSQFLINVEIITTEEVLGEVLTFYSKAGVQMRKRTIVFVKEILTNPDIKVIEQTHESFLLGFHLYQNRLDKGYSLADCISMNTMNQLAIKEVLSHDHHFLQEGFILLFSDV